MKYFQKIVSGIGILMLAMIVGIGTVQAQDDVVEVVKNSDNHTVFTELLEETELDDLLKQEGPYTVLAPTDEAFDKLDRDVSDLKENPDELQNIVIGHLYNGQIASADVEQAKNVEVTNGDIEAGNGTVHVVEEVLME